MDRTRAGNMLTMGLLTVAVGLLGWAASIWVRDGKKIATLRASHAQHEADVKTTRTELNAVGIQYRGFQKTRDSLPDSLRKATKVETRNEEKRYQRDLRRLEVAEYNLMFEMKQLKRRESEAIAERNTRVRPYWMAGAGTLGLVGIAFASTRRRPKPLDDGPAGALS
jgi:hypothetical protein